MNRFIGENSLISNNKTFCSITNLVKYKEMGNIRNGGLMTASLVIEERK